MLPLICGCVVTISASSVKSASGNSGVVQFGPKLDVAPFILNVSPIALPRPTCTYNIARIEAKMVKLLLLTLVLALSIPANCQRCKSNTDLHVDTANSCAWPGFDFGAWLNAPAASLPSTGGVINL